MMETTFFGPIWRVLTKSQICSKHLNPPNVPQARPIENFRGCLAQKVYEGGWEAKTEQRLIDRIHRKLREFDLKFVESLMRGVKAKVKSLCVFS